MPDKKYAKPLISSCFFLVVMIGQCYLLRNMMTVPISNLPFTLLVELGATAVILYGAAKSANPQGWGSVSACGGALVLFVAYASFNAINYELLSQVYLTGFTNPQESYGTAIVAGKICLLLMGVIAAIPAKPQILPEEYADLFVEAMEKQKVEWAKSSALGAKKDLEKAQEALQINSEMTED
ncbi:hypothetical protein V6615_04535 [Oscillospiraceae bacterium PP1C4]